MNKKKNLQEKIEMTLLGVVPIWLFYAIGSKWEYETYTLMRFYVAYVAIQLAFWHRQFLLPLLAFAVLYQPIFKLHLSRETWGIINAITAVGAIVMGIWLIKCQNYLYDLFHKRSSK